MTELKSIDNLPNDYIIAGKFQLKQKIGNGSFGHIYLAINLENNENIALKLEKRSSSKVFTIAKESKVLSIMNNALGFPKLITYGKEESYGYLGMNLLGHNLEKLFKLCDRKFTLKTILIITDQILNRIETLHNKNLIHRDIKPENFCLGNGVNINQIYLIDFGLAKPYKYSNGTHITYREDRGLIGTARYASINAHLGIEQSRRDDLESIGYMLIYLMKSRLPWQNVHSINKQDKYQQISDLKIQTSVDILCKDLPHAFVEYFDYVKSLGFTQQPNYQYIKKIFRQLFIKSGFDYDYKYDWISISTNQPTTNDSNNNLQTSRNGVDIIRNQLDNNPIHLNIKNVVEDKEDELMKYGIRQVNKLYSKTMIKVGDDSPIFHQLNTNKPQLLINVNQQKIQCNSNITRATTKDLKPDIKISLLENAKMPNFDTIVDFRSKFEPNHLHPLTNPRIMELSYKLKSSRNDNGTIDSNNSSKLAKLNKNDTKTNIDSKTLIDDDGYEEDIIPNEYDKKYNIEKKLKSFKDPKFFLNFKGKIVSQQDINLKIKQETLKKSSSNMTVRKSTNQFIIPNREKLKSKAILDEENINEEDIKEWRNGISIGNMIEGKKMRM